AFEAVERLPGPYQGLLHRVIGVEGRAEHPVTVTGQLTAERFERLEREPPWHGVGRHPALPPRVPTRVCLGEDRPHQTCAATAPCNTRRRTEPELIATEPGRTRSARCQRVVSRARRALPSGTPRPVQASQPGPASYAPLLPEVMSRKPVAVAPAAAPSYSNG